jgi:hypothetical protein
LIPLMKVPRLIALGLFFISSIFSRSKFYPINGLVFA